MAMDAAAAEHRIAEELAGAGPRGWFRRLASPFRDDADVETTYAQRMTAALTVPARGDVFDFRVFPNFVWTAKGMSQRSVERWATQLSLQACRMIRAAIAPIARTFPPHHTQELEERLNTHLRNRSWPVGSDGVRLRISPQVRVEHDPRLEDQLRPYWEQRIKLECDHELGIRRAELTEKLTRSWCDILAGLEGNPLSRHAARLTDGPFADVFVAFIDQQQSVVHEMVDLLRRAIDGHGGLGLGPSEFTRAWDAALTAFRRQHGLESFETGADSLAEDP